MPEYEKIESLVIESVEILAKDFEIDGLSEVTPESLLYCEGGTLDSMALVNLVADIEDAVADKFKTVISLADDRAISAKHSPFRSVKDLSEAILERLPK